MQLGRRGFRPAPNGHLAPAASRSSRSGRVGAGPGHAGRRETAGAARKAEPAVSRVTRAQDGRGNVRPECPGPAPTRPPALDPDLSLDQTPDPPPSLG